MVEMMKAITLDGFGGPEVLRVSDVPKPTPLPTEVLVRVHAAGVNPVDWKSRAGHGASGLLSKPAIIGWDVSGVVEAVGGGVTRFSPGDEVLGMPWFPRQAGAYAEYATAPSHQFSRKPDQLSHSEAAGLPLVGLTAWQALVEIAGVHSGQRVLVNAAAGGVGHIAVQIAKARGAYVLGTAKTAKHEFLGSLGVDEPIDYTQVNVAEEVKNIDLVLDMLGGKGAVSLLSTLRPDGILVTDPGSYNDELRTVATQLGVRVSPVLVEPDRGNLEDLLNIIPIP